MPHPVSRIINNILCEDGRFLTVNGPILIHFHGSPYIIQIILRFSPYFLFVFQILHYISLSLLFRLLLAVTVFQVFLIVDGLDSLEECWPVFC